LSNTIQHLDFIGDIHGYADELESLLEKLGYSKLNMVYQHPTRKAFFVGDFIDRGPQIRKVLEIVRPMITNGYAYTVIGNHEYNAICYFTEINGKPLRSHSQKNNSQIRQTKDAFSNNRDLLLDYVDWFKSLPIFLESPLVRVIHAQWKETYVNTLKSHGVNDFQNIDFLAETVQPFNSWHKLTNCLLRGEEMKISGAHFRDADGHKREAYRVKWWLPEGEVAAYDYLINFPTDSENALPIIYNLGYKLNQPPVFFGHYCLKKMEPILFQKNICCLDYCVANSGKIVAYRWNGEQILKNENFVF
jgi:hypothetical protein